MKTIRKTLAVLLASIIPSMFGQAPAQAAGHPIITSPLTATGSVGNPFAYTITAVNNPTSYGTSPLPPGLSLSGALIHGTPSVPGIYHITIYAANTFGVGGAVLTLTIINSLSVKLILNNNYSATASTASLGSSSGGFAASNLGAHQSVSKVVYMAKLPTQYSAWFATLDNKFVTCNRTFTTAPKDQVTAVLEWNAKGCNISGW